MNTQIIIIGHGHYATGCQSTIELIAGPQLGVTYIDFGLDGMPDALYDKVRDILTHFESDGLLFLCDIVGGTPFKTAVQATFDCQHTNSIVLAGVNMSAMIEVILQRDILTNEELATKAVEETKQTVLRFVAQPVSKVMNQTDGI